MSKPNILNTWEKFKKFVNSVPEGQVFTRTAMKAVVGESPSRPTTVDSYRRMCELTGYIRKGSRPGLYIKVKNIPKGALKNDVKEEAYGYRNYDDRSWLRTKYLTVEEPLITLNID